MIATTGNVITTFKIDKTGLSRTNAVDSVTKVSDMRFSGFRRVGDTIYGISPVDDGKDSVYRVDSDSPELAYEGYGRIIDICPVNPMTGIQAVLVDQKPDGTVKVRFFRDLDSGSPTGDAVVSGIRPLESPVGVTEVSGRIYLLTNMSLYVNGAEGDMYKFEKVFDIWNGTRIIQGGNEVGIARGDGTYGIVTSADTFSPAILGE